MATTCCWVFSTLAVSITRVGAGARKQQMLYWLSSRVLSHAFLSQMVILHMVTCMFWFVFYTSSESNLSPLPFWVASWHSLSSQEITI